MTTHSSGVWGGSTIFLAKRCRHVISVEHDAGWFEMARSTIRENLEDSLWKRLLRRFRSQQMPELHLVEPETADVGAPSAIRSGSKGYEHADFSRYVSVIDPYPQNHFDLILVDGRARVDCLERAIPHCRVGGYIVLDNSDYARYADRLAELESGKLNGWTKTDFLGPGPSSSCVGWNTTVYQRTR